MSVDIDRPERPSADEILAQARNADGSPRFHPPGQHPATEADRRSLDEARHIQANLVVPIRAADELIAFLERRIAEVELGEQRAKRAYLEQMA